MRNETTNDPPQWALDRAKELIGSDYVADIINTFATYIAQHEPAPVDPLLQLAREMEVGNYSQGTYTEKVLSGECDDNESVRYKMRFLRQAYELGQKDAKDAAY